MKEDIINRLVAVVQALNKVEIRGRSNIDNMSGSLRVLDDVINMVNNLEEQEQVADDKQKGGK